ncbi:MAG TPA: aldo/keto reductase [Candidatus Saccharimonadales bacterium]|nr:aldo/keto reductase [Candidatus Saccharimonadales bacterium]
MDYLTLNNKVKIPQLGFGTWKLKPLGEAKKATKYALEVGYRHIDTAHIYLNEHSVGKAIAESGIARKDIFITTKLWNWDQKHAHRAFDESLKKLGVEYIDLYLMHYPVTETRLQAWKDMEEIYKSGRAKAIGVSNFAIRHLEQLLKNSQVVPAINQVELHPFLYQKELMGYCKSKDIAVEAYSPLVHGERMDNPVISEIANKHKKTNAQVLLRWNLQHGNIVIPKSKTPGRIKENFEVFDFELAKEEMLKLNGLNEGLIVFWDTEKTP